MASIEKRTRDGKVRWYARYRDPTGQQRTKTFDRKVDAERYLTATESSKMMGSYVDPAMARLTVGALSEQWLAGQQHLKPSTRERYAGILRSRITPRWGTTKLADVTHGDVQTWVSAMAVASAPATVRKTYNVLSLVLSLAVADGRLSRNPAVDVKLPRVVDGERRYLSHDEVRRVAAHAGPYRLIVLFLAYTGVRFGELAALEVGRLDLLRRRATISHAVTEVNSRLEWGTPKGHQRRDVPIPRFLVDDLVAHVAGRASDDLVFPGVTGVPLRVRVFRGPFDRAVEAAGLPKMHPHEMRHTAASLAIASGANVKVVQQMLGHKSATLTLDLYGHLFPDQLDDVADRLDAAARASADVYPLCTEAEIVDFPQASRKAAGQ